MEKLRILYAEDDPLTVLELVEKLEGRGFEVIVATNGNEALEKFNAGQPDAVILDVDMPGLNGFEVLQLIRLKDRQTPIIIYSSLSDDDNKMFGLASGAMTFLVKDTNPDFVAAQVQRYLENRDGEKVALGKEAFFDMFSGELCINQRKDKLVGLEFKIFTLLCRNREKTVSREVLIKAGWNSDDYKLQFQLNKYISNLRHKIAGTSAHIVTDKYNGYRLQVEK